MYPSEYLNRLALEKQVLIGRSAELRLKAIIAGSTVAKPVLMIENAAGMIRRFAPLLTLSSLFLPRKTLGRRIGVLGLAWKWGPTLFRVFKSFKASRNGGPFHPPVSP